MLCQDYVSGKPFWGEGVTWVGLKWFKEFVSSYYFSRILRNTLVLNGMNLLFGFCVPIILLGMELPFFILQPILEKAFVYGISQTLDACTLTVDAHEDESRIVLAVSNTGRLISQQRLQEVNELLSGEVSGGISKGNAMDWH